MLFLRCQQYFNPLLEPLLLISQLHILSLEYLYLLLGFVNQLDSWSQLVFELVDSFVFFEELHNQLTRMQVFPVVLLKVIDLARVTRSLTSIEGSHAAPEELRALTFLRRPPIPCSCH